MVKMIVNVSRYPNPKDAVKDIIEVSVSTEDGFSYIFTVDVDASIKTKDMLTSYKDQVLSEYQRWKKVCEKLTIEVDV